MKILEIRNGKTVVATLFVSRIDLISEGDTRYELDLDGNNIGYINAESVSVIGENTAKIIVNTEKIEKVEKNIGNQF